MWNNKIVVIRLLSSSFSSGCIDFKPGSVSWVIFLIKLKKVNNFNFYLWQSFMLLIHNDLKPGPRGRIIFLMMKCKV